MEVDLPDEKLLSVVKPTEIKHGANEAQEIKESLRNPIEERRLRDLASKEKNSVLLLAITRELYPTTS
jgi:nickel-dependent lactate racemase